LIKFNYSSNSFIGVAFPVRFLGFMCGELEHDSTFYAYDVFRSLNMDSLCSIQARSHISVSNLLYNANLDSELDCFKSLHRASENFTCPYSVYGRLGKVSFGFDKFGIYGAANLRKITGVVSRNRIISLWSFPLYQLEILKEPPSSTRYPITYKYDVVDSCYTVVEGIHSSCGFSESNKSWASQVFIEIGFFNPKDIMIHSSINQFKHWSDVFLNRLGIDIYRRI